MFCLFVYSVSLRLLPFFFLLCAVVGVVVVSVLLRGMTSFCMQCYETEYLDSLAHLWYIFFQFKCRSRKYSVFSRYSIRLPESCFVRQSCFVLSIYIEYIRKFSFHLRSKNQIKIKVLSESDMKEPTHGAKFTKLRKFP